MSFLQDELGVSEAQVLRILVRAPKLLSLGVESLRRKRTYFEEALHLNADDVRSAHAASTRGTAEIARASRLGETVCDTWFRLKIMFVFSASPFIKKTFQTCP